MEHAMKDLLPRRLIAVVLAESGIASDLRAQSLSRVQRQRLGAKLHDLSMSITGTRPLEEAHYHDGRRGYHSGESKNHGIENTSRTLFAGEIWMWMP